MTLIINKHDVEQVLTMEMTLDALEESYLALAAREAVCRPRITRNAATLLNRSLPGA
jgi:alanine dehydrogenase